LILWGLTDLLRLLILSYLSDPKHRVDR
jgi:hypothetical protein